MTKLGCSRGTNMATLSITLGTYLHWVKHIASMKCVAMGQSAVLCVTQNAEFLSNVWGRYTRAVVFGSCLVQY